MVAALSGLRRLLLLSAAAGLSACATPTAPRAAAAPPSAPAEPAPPQPAGTEALPSGERPGDPLCGTVLEHLTPRPKSYLRLSTGSGEKWVATAQGRFALGQRVCFIDLEPVDELVSNALRRTFHRIYFATLLTPIPPPPGGLTIAQIWQERRSLSGRTVLVAGTVIRLTRDVMGRNWLRLRDGSGTLNALDDVLTVTTADVAAVGTVVVVEGKVSADRDFGAGILHPVVVEDAKVTPRPSPPAP